MMLRYLFFFVIAIHGLIHLIGFIALWKILPIKGFSGHALFLLSEVSSRMIGLAWLLTALFFLGAAITYWLHKTWWWLPAFIAVLFSQLLIGLYCNDAKVGTVTNLLVLLVVIVSFASWRFNSKVEASVETLFKNEIISESQIEEKQLAHLPAPVQLWLKKSGVLERGVIHTVRLKQQGLMRLKPEQQKWIMAYAWQYITIDQPAYIWKVRMNMMPLLPVVGGDQFLNGHGKMNIKLFSLVDIVNAADEKIDQGSLQRWLAEMCWYPSAALSSYVQWEDIDALIAKATMSYNGTSGSVTFHFTKEGDLAGVEANRYMGGGEDATLERWSVKCIEYGSFDGIRMPILSEATWKLKTGDFTWYQLRITDVEFNKPENY